MNSKRHTFPKLGVYVHWPYCARICPYCDFNVYKNRTLDIDVWKNSLQQEIRYWFERLPQRPLESLYFGGGTPSLMPETILGDVIDLCFELWGFRPSAEITLEANPTDITEISLSTWKSAGVNRLSLGVQSFDDDALQLLGRNHSSKQARSALGLIGDAFDRFTFDLIYARPEQTLLAWEHELETALSYGAGHLSLYQLTIEPGTAFDNAVNRGAMKMFDADKMADFYELGVKKLSDAGLRHYEISNFAKAGHEACHNTIYWQYQDYIGIGPGAHGRVTMLDESGKVERYATETELTPEHWLKNTQAEGHGVSLHTKLTSEQAMLERFSMGLRLEEGIDLQDEDSFFHDPARAHKLTTLLQGGFLDFSANKLKATSRGRQLLDSVLLELFSE